MQSIHKLLVAVACALPLVAGAQMSSPSSSTAKPADTPRTELEKEQTTKNGQATKYGSPGTDTGGAIGKSTGTTDSGMSGGRNTMKHKGSMDKAGQTAPGDVPTYPAPAKDGTPTK